MLSGGLGRHRPRGPHAMASSEDYRHLAAECLRIAHENQTERNRTLLLRMAHLWGKLAERAGSAQNDELDLGFADAAAPDTRGTQGS